MKKIYRVTCSLGWSSYKITVLEIEVEETKSGYQYPDDYLPGKKNYVNKKRLLKVDTHNTNRISGNQIDSISFFIFCLADQLEKSKTLVMNAVEERFKEIRNSIGMITKNSLGSPATEKKVYDPKNRYK
jgi:hypothetical protein